MKKTKRFLAVVLCMLLMLTPLAVVAETVTVQAAGPQTVKVKLDKKTGKRYGYDENNQKVTQQWGVTAKGFRYYFGKNGAAYQADQDMVGKYGILMKKINGKYYGFDVSGHTVKGIRVGSVSMYDIPKLYYFNPKTGAVDKKKTSLYRKYAATSTLAKQNNASKIKKVLGKYKKCTISKGNTCMLDGNGSITGGSIMYDGKDLAKFKKEKEWMTIRGKKIAMVMQDPMTSLNPLKKVGKQIQECIELHQGLKGAVAKKATLQILEKVGIPYPEMRYNQYPHEFSGGMRQRVVIAIAVACRPQILICDEPTTALDVTIQAQILELIRNLQAEYHMSVIYITHDLGVVANVADRVAVMYAGQIVEVGKVDEIFYDARHPYTWALLSALPQLGVKGEALPTIDGTPPNLFNKIKGDAFAPRNRQALAIDFEEEPPYFEVSETHKAKTWYLDPRAPKIEPPKSVQQLRQKMRAHK